MEVKSVNNTGAFLEWGLMKDLLVPFKEQKMPMQRRKMVFGICTRRSCNWTYSCLR